MNADRQPRQIEALHLFKWILLSSILLFLVMALPAMLGLVPTSDDLGAFHLPLRSIYAECLKNGESFDWVSNLYSGFYLSGEGQVGGYHPLHWGLYRFLPLGAAFNAELLLSYPFMFVGTYLFLKRTVEHSDAALFGAMVFTFSGFNLLHYVHPNAIAIAAHLPWILLAIDIAWCESQRRHVFAEVSIALLMASQLLLGYPQYVWFCLLAAVSFVVFLSWRDGVRAKSYLLLSALFVLGVAIGAIQLFPTFDVLARSSRATSDASFYHMGALHPLNLVQLVCPYLFKSRVVGGNTHELGLYFGAAPLILLCWLFARRNKLSQQHRRLAIAAALFGVVTLFLAFGKYGLIYHLQTYLPLVGRFRNPARYIFLFHFAVAILIAVAFVELKTYFADNNLDSEPPHTGVIPTILSVVFAIAAYVLLDRRFLSSPMLVASGPLLMLASSTLLQMILRSSKIAVIAMIIFTAADLGSYGLSYAVLPNNHRLVDFISGTSGPPERDDYRLIVDRQLRKDDDQLRSGNRWLLGGWFQADGYAGLDPSSKLFGNNVSIQSLQAASVRWVRDCGKNDSIPGLVLIGDGWLEVPDPCPRVRLVTDCVVSADASTTIQRISPATTAVVASDLNLSSGPAGSVEILKDRPGDIHIRTHVSSTQLLVISERYHDGWSCTADNESLPVLRVNGDFMGCVLQPGTEDVELSFQPQSLSAGKSVTTYALLALVFFAFWRCNFRPDPLRGSTARDSECK